MKPPRLPLALLLLVPVLLGPVLAGRAATTPADRTPGLLAAGAPAAGGPAAPVASAADLPFAWCVPGDETGGPDEGAPAANLSRTVVADHGFRQAYVVPVVRTFAGPPRYHLFCVLLI